jgi:hypothetical protein
MSGEAVLLVVVPLQLALEIGCLQHSAAVRAPRLVVHLVSFTTDEKSTRGESGYWLSLRGREDHVLPQ